MKAKICIPANCPAVGQPTPFVALNLVPLGRAEMLATPGASTQIQISRNHFRFELNQLIHTGGNIANPTGPLQGSGLK
jgi:hypothetical protein